MFMVSNHKSKLFPKNYVSSAVTMAACCAVHSSKYCSATWALLFHTAGSSCSMACYFSRNLLHRGITASILDCFAVLEARGVCLESKRVRRFFDG